MLVAPNTTYVPTADDVLWLSRAVEAEGEPRTRVAATLVNGFMWARSKLGVDESLADWVKRYAQPVNPAWFPGGPKFLASFAAATTDAERTRLERVAEKRRDVNATRTTFSTHTVAAVTQALTHPPELRGAVDYAPEWVRKPGNWQAFTQPKRGQNRFWARPGAVGWSGYTVAGFMADPRASMGGLVLVLVLGAAVVLLLRKGR